MTRLLPSRLALGRDEAAQSLGISPTTFDAQVAPHLRRVRVGSGKRPMFAVAEIERWLRESSTPAPMSEARRAG